MSDLVGLIDSKFFDHSCPSKGLSSNGQILPLASTWSFELDDGMFQWQGNLASNQDLIRHLQRITEKLTSVHEAKEKATVRCFRAGFSQYLPAEGASKFWGRDPEEEDAGKWVMRFSLKASFQVLDKWLELVLASVTETLPSADSVAGCVFTCRKGKCEMELWMARDPLLPGKKGFEAPCEKELQAQIRAALGIEEEDKNVLIQYKAHCDVMQSRLERRKVRKVQKKKSKGSTWPLVANHEAKADLPTAHDAIQHAKEDAYAYYNFQDQGSNNQQGEVYRYSFKDARPEDEEDNDRPTFNYSDLLQKPEDLIVEAAPAEKEQQEFAPLPAPVVLPRYSTEELGEMQQQQLASLALTLPSEEDEAAPAPPLDLSLLRSRLDSTEFTHPPLPSLIDRLNSLGDGSLPHFDLSMLSMPFDSSDFVSAAVPVPLKDLLVSEQPETVVQPTEQPTEQSTEQLFPTAEVSEAEEEAQADGADDADDDEDDDDHGGGRMFAFEGESETEDDFVVRAVGRRMSTSDMYGSYLAKTYKKEETTRAKSGVPELVVSGSSPPCHFFGTNPPDLTSPVMSSTFARKWK